MFLRRALDSILGQTFKDFEIIIVNDGADSVCLKELVAEYQKKTHLKCINTAGSEGMEAASNIGIQNSEAPYITLLDDDDSWAPSFLEKTVTFLNSKLGQMYGGVVTKTNVLFEEVVGDTIVINSRELMNCRNHISIPDLCEQNLFTTNAFVYRRDCYERIGGYDERLPILGDWEFNLRFILDSEIAVLDEYLSNYHKRIGLSNSDIDNSLSLDSYKAAYVTKVRNDFIRKTSDPLLPMSLIMATKGHDFDRLYSSENTMENYISNTEIRRLLFERWKLLNASDGDSTVPEEFDEDRYLEIYPDVRNALEDGGLTSAFQHYLLYGEKEGREYPLKEKYM
jgi:glycosyltransferase involved in cell wall biosynthesis